MISISLFSCGYSTFDTRRSCIVTSIEQTTDGYCYYYGDGYWGDYFTLSDLNFRLTDSIGKYNVGDTIKLTK